MLKKIGRLEGWNFEDLLVEPTFKNFSWNFSHMQHKHSSLKYKKSSQSFLHVKPLLCTVVSQTQTQQTSVDHCRRWLTVLLLKPTVVFWSLHKTCFFSPLLSLQMLTYFSAFEVFFEENLPKLFAHFKKNNLTPDIYLIDWWVSRSRSPLWLASFT